MEKGSLYEADFVRSLFNEMSQTYGIVNLVSSFGFTIWWRKRCASEIQSDSDSVVVDLMAGMGELCLEVSQQLGPQANLIAIDNSPAMCERAIRHSFQANYAVLEADALDCPLQSASVDNVYSTFGLKTFGESQTRVLATELSRVL